MKIITLLFALWSSVVSAQSTLGHPFPLPISINTAGEIGFLSGGEGSIRFTPMLQFALSKSTYNYSQSIASDGLQFLPLDESKGWLEMRNYRIEGGIGFRALVENVTNIGLVPYKGAMNTILRFKNTNEGEPFSYKLPKKLQDLNAWTPSDYGRYQTYGGIKTYIGASTAVGLVASATFEIQNQFQIELTKKDSELVALKISEVDLKDRSVRLGPIPAYFVNYFLTGKKLVSEFELDLTNPEHHELYEDALDGNIEALQKRLPVNSVNVNWESNDKHLYYGIPLLIGKHRSSAHYEINENGQESEVNVLGRMNKGFLIPVRNKQNYVYQTDKGVALLWTSEMKKVNDEAIENHFLSYGKTIGVKGFDQEVPDGRKMGAVVSVIGISFSRAEVEEFKNVNLSEVTHILKTKCDQENLPCRREGKLNRIMKKFSRILRKPWIDMRGDLGLLMIKEPALVHSLLKSSKLQKEAYFKFMSEKFQSMEGSSPIEI